jgi:hypothetical protein
MKKLLSFVAVALVFAAATVDAKPFKPLDVCSATLTLDDVTLDGRAADAFFGPVCGENPKLDDLEDLFGGGWDAFFTSDEGKTTPWGSRPWEWELGFAPGPVQGQGAWTLGIVHGPAVTADLAILLKAGNDWAAYLFEGVPLSSENGGDYRVRFTNGGGSYPALSHLALAARDPEQVSEPASLLLVGVGLALAGFKLRRRR